jgi:mRNA-degrading endonuclease RelE of RelBE toxin-antitoxin system
MNSFSFNIELTHQAEKDLLRLRPWTAQVLNELQALRENPYKGHTLTGSLRGCRALEFSLHDGAYRAVYVVQPQDQVCVVFLVGPHENLYKKAERRLQALRKHGRI